MSQFINVSLNTPQRSPSELRIRTAYKKSTEKKNARIKELEYHLAEKEKQMQIQKAEFDRQLASKEAANQDLRESNQRLENELEKRNVSFRSLLRMYWDQESKLSQSQVQHEPERKAHTQLYMKRPASIDFEASQSKKYKSQTV